MQRVSESITQYREVTFEFSAFLFHAQSIDRRDEGGKFEGRRAVLWHFPFPFLSLFVFIFLVLFFFAFLFFLFFSFKTLHRILWLAKGLQTDGTREGGLLTDLRMPLFSDIERCEINHAINSIVNRSLLARLGPCLGST
mmetsp:Transcript_21244/g.42213  ORF Transcript_21244/g.42213 Transcript_21244/m.42213 type:complete len:139 (-) Transcript_21244:239-655(-)